MLIFISAVSVSAELLKVAVIRVAFQADSSPATTGDGSFVLVDTTDLECSDWTLDPPPHNKTYFQDHLIAADNYWQRVSNGHVSIDLINSAVFPSSETAVYELPHDMLYYHPYLEDFDETAKLFELSQDALDLADADIDFNAFSTIILVHAGMGGDFAFALDPTPGNIPSAYLSQSDFLEYGTTLHTLEKDLNDLIIIPESQNFLQYAETRSLFADAEDPCFYQVGLNGTIALMLGFHLGLPPLYNTETGQSLVGGFALMDQGSNNFHGIVPAYPDPYTRINAGWITPTEKWVGADVVLTQNDPPIRISISDSEYYLIENRQRNLHEPSEMIQWIDGPGFDTVSVTLSDESGVVLRVDEQNAGLPGNGLHIWHVDENAWLSAENPNGGAIQLIDFEEADGAQDMGFETQLLFADYLETGWWFDPWFAGNEGWFHLNRSQDIVGDSLLSFSSSTFPSTYSNTGKPSHLRIENISKNGSTMSFSIGSDRIVDQTGLGEIIGWDSTAHFWGFNADRTNVVRYSFNNGRVTSTPSLEVDPALIYSGSIDSVLTFRHPWIATNIGSSARFLNIESGAVHYNSSIQDPFELAVGAMGHVLYFAEKDADYVQVRWFPLMGTSTSVTLLDRPLARFQTTTGIQHFYGDPDLVPMPAGVTPRRDPDDLFQLIQEQIDVISWSTAENILKISHLPDAAEDFLSVDQPQHIIPLDTDSDGIYEIALFYANSVKIINQAGILWNGNPFSVDAYYGNPIVGPLVNGQVGIYLRHANHYSIHSFDGQLVEEGLLPDPVTGLENFLRVADGLTLLQSGDQLLYFEYAEREAGALFWTDPQGSPSGDRLVHTLAVPVAANPEIKSGSVYNYPNPVKGNQTTIRAWIGAVDTWTIEIFSLSGAQVAYKGLDVQQQNGYNEWVWDASALSNGVFLAQIVAGDQAEIIKIAIIR